MDLETLDADQWQVLREVRLRALKDSPTAFLADYEEELFWNEASWRERFVDSQWVIARNERWIVGLARALRVDDRPPDERHIESVWVDPRYRRTGVLRAILHYLTGINPDVNDWLVWVLDDNALAGEVYRRLGFRPTGESQPLTDGTGRNELRFRFRAGRA